MSASDSYACATLRERTDWIRDSGGFSVKDESPTEDNFSRLIVHVSDKSNLIRTSKGLYGITPNSRVRMYSSNKVGLFLAKYSEAYLEGGVEKLFSTLADTWDAQVFMTSSLEKQVLNENYQRIIGLGPTAIPLILRRLKSMGGNWFWALRAIAGEDPISADDYGDYEEMRKSWVKWGVAKGLING